MIRYFVLCGSVVKSRVVGGISSETLRRKDDVVHVYVLYHFLRVSGQELAWLDLDHSCN